MTNPFDVIQEIKSRLVLGIMHFVVDAVQMYGIHDATILDGLPMIVVIVLIELNELLEICIYLRFSLNNCFKWHSRCSVNYLPLDHQADALWLKPTIYSNVPHS